MTKSAAGMQMKVQLFKQAVRKSTQRRWPVG